MVKTEKIWKDPENPEKSGNRINSRKMKSSYHIFQVNQTFYKEIWLKLRKKKLNREEIRKPDKFPENEFIISYLRSKPSILSRNISKIAEIWRFEKKEDECEKKSKSITSELSLTK